MSVSMFVYTASQAEFLPPKTETKKLFSSKVKDSVEMYSPLTVL